LTDWAKRRLHEAGIKGRAEILKYLEVDGGDSAAVDWPGSTGGRFS
jgi:hypothetical protein